MLELEVDFLLDRRDGTVAELVLVPAEVVQIKRFPPRAPDLLEVEVIQIAKRFAIGAEPAGERTGWLDVRGEIVKIGVGFLDRSERRRHVFGTFAVSSPPPTASSSSLFGSSQAGLTLVSQRSRVLTIRDVGRAPVEFAFEQRLKIAIRPISSWKEKVRAERRLAGPLPRAAWDVAWFACSIMRRKTVPVSLAFTRRLGGSWRSSSLGFGRPIGQLRSPPLGIEFARESRPARGPFRAEVLRRRGFPGSLPFATARADRCAPAPASGWFIDSRIVTEIQVRPRIKGPGVRLDLRNRQSFPPGRRYLSWPPRRGCRTPSPSSPARIPLGRRLEPRIRQAGVAALPFVQRGWR